MSLLDVLTDELRDLYSAENQLVKALPNLVKAAEDEGLSTSIKNHLEETKGHVERLKKVFTLLEEKPTGKHCKGMEGLIEEGKEAVEEDEEAPLGDILIIGAASRVEHYEIAGYTAVIEMASALGKTQIVELLSQTLEEEEAASAKLNETGTKFIQVAAEEEETETSHEDGSGQATGRKKSPNTAVHGKH